MRLNTAMANTAIGMEAETVRPARSARYTVAAPKMMPKMAPRTMALSENSGTVCDAGMNGWNCLAGSGMASPWAMATGYSGPLSPRREGRQYSGSPISW